MSAYYVSNEKVYPFANDRRRGFELFWQTAYVNHLEDRNKAAQALYYQNQPHCQFGPGEVGANDLDLPGL